MATRPLRCCALLALLGAPPSCDCRRMPPAEALLDASSAEAGRFTPAHALHAALAAAARQQAPAMPSPPVVIPSAPPSAARTAAFRPRPLAAADTSSFERFVKEEGSGKREEEEEDGAESPAAAEPAAKPASKGFAKKPAAKTSSAKQPVAAAPVAKKPAAQQPFAAAKKPAAKARISVEPVAEASAEPEAAASGASEAAPELVRVRARGVMNQKPGPHMIPLPSVWLDKFEVGSVTTARLTSDPPFVFGTGTARLKSDPAREVRFVAMKPNDPGTVREIEMSRAMRETGVVPVHLETFKHKDVTYMLTSAPGLSLASLQERTPFADNLDFAGEQMWFAPHKLAKVLIATLRALVAFEEAGIVHADLSEQTIFMSEENSRAQITGMYFSHEEGKGAEEEAGSMVGSAFRQPPESEGERVDGAGSNVWQAGLIMARLMFGGGVPTAVTAKQVYPSTIWDDRSPAGREKIRAAVRNSFSLGRFPAFKRLRSDYPALLNIVAGMLQIDPEKRLTATEALEMAEEVAGGMGVSWVSPSDASKLVSEWLQAWRK